MTKYYARIILISDFVVTEMPYNLPNKASIGCKKRIHNSFPGRAVIR